MKIRISAGDVSIEREIPTADRIPVRAREPLYLRRKRVLEAVVRNRRRQFRLIDGGRDAT
ncbi:MAG: hypothetical protein JWN27_2960 [Candidatus Eremiobacteraeota bacterium]|nr:hypothetical protein [Candidatus Eremiobacteraeota bacterium]